MKVHDIRVHPIHTEIPAHKRVESGAGLKLARQMCLIEIESADGLVGYGSPSGPYDLGVLTALIEGAIKPYLLSVDPGDIEQHWDRLYFGEISRNSGNRSVGMAALSGVDIALWDLKGKTLGVPLYDLLGGQFHSDGVRTYASSIYWDTTPQAAAEEATVLVDQGFRAVKLKVGRSFEHDAANISAISHSLDTGIELLIDANQSLDRIGANRLLAVAEDHGCYWFEEPLSIDDIEGHRQLREKRRIVRIATGENLYGRWAFTDFVRNEAIDVLQADVSRAGGITEVRKIADLASCHHLTWNPHTFNDLITVAANLHLVTASPQAAMFEWDITHNALMDDLADWTLDVYDGVVRAPDGPGLGLEIDMGFVKAHRWAGQPSIGAGHPGRS
jgi:D-galactarolactone cycloisomerase